MSFWNGILVFSQVDIKPDPDDLEHFNPQVDVMDERLELSPKHKRTVPPLA